MAKSNYADQFINMPSLKNGSVPSNLNPSKNLDDSFINSVGLYSKKDIDEYRFTRYSRFGRVLDPQGKLNDGREYLFFVKPDLHITKTGNSEIYKISGNETSDSIKINGLTLNPQLGNSPYFQSLLWTHPEVVKELQYSVVGNSTDPFSHLLSTSVSSYLEIPGMEAGTMDNSSTMLGATYDYLRDGENSDENPSFNLEFADNKHLDIYHFFRAYAEYHIVRKSGLVTPPSMDYYWYKQLHNAMGIYKFIVSEDMETILYWAYYWGVYPTSVPRETFSDPLFADGANFSVSFKAAFVEDMNPMILEQFNELMSPLISDKKNWLPTVKQNLIDDTDNFGYKHSYDPTLNHAGSFDTNHITNGEENYNDGLITTNSTGGFPSSMIDGTLPRYALVDNGVSFPGESSIHRYKLRWYA